MEKEKQMNEKPLSVAITEVKKGIASIINGSGLPIYISEMIIKDIYNDIIEVSNQVKDTEYSQYIQAQETQKIEKESNKEAN